MLVAQRTGWALPAAPPVVDTPYGALRGEALPGCSVYRGVPFAAPPRRFRPAEPPARWAGVREATHFAPAAMQPGYAPGDDSEDCLYLNVWAPTEPGPHPVFVWVHGGGFTAGRSSDPLQDGALFARQGIVTVTVAYRLGVFGFLDLRPVLGAGYAASANTALGDLVQALTWVHTSIASFGGDPARVTVGGQSAGAKLTGILLGVPAAQGLFAQAVSESGGAERVATEAAAEAVAHGFAQSWTEVSGLQAAALATAPAPQLIAAQEAFTKSWPLHFPLRCSLDAALLPRLPVEAVAAGTARGKRLLIGTNRDESAFFAGAAPEAVTARELGNVPLGRFEQVAARYQAAFPQTEPSRLRIRELTAEEYFVPSMRLLQAFTQAGATAYAYRMDWSRGTGRLAGFAFHSLELPLVWATDAEKGAATPEATLAREVQGAWVAFVRGGAPAAPGLPPWPAYRAGEGAAMLLNTPSEVVRHFAEDELGLWQGVM